MKKKYTKKRIHDEKNGDYKNDEEIGDISNKFPVFKDRRKQEGYVSSIQLYNNILGKKFVDILEMFKTEPVLLCKEIISKKQFLDMLSEGQTGSAFKFNDIESFSNIVIKEIKTKKIVMNMNNDVIINDSATHEMIMSSLSNVLHKINKCFLRYDGYFFCNPMKNGKVSGYMVMEKMDGILQAHLSKKIIGVAEFKSILFQILFAAVTMQKKYKMTHRDMHNSNIGVNVIDSSNPLEFYFGKKRFIVPNYGIITRIFDYDLSYVGHPTPLVSENSLEMKFVNIKPKFQPGYDVAQIIGFFFRQFLIFREGIKKKIVLAAKKKNTKISQKFIDSELLQQEKYQKIQINLSSSIEVNFSIAEINEFYKLFSLLISNIYKKLGIKAAIDKFAAIDPNSVNVNDDDLPDKTKFLFVTRWGRPSPILADADLSTIIISEPFSEYRKNKYKGKVEKIANVK